MRLNGSGKPLNNGLLRHCIERSIELPHDGLTGECIVHFGGIASMKVNMVNGVREGEAVIVKNGKPYYKLEYKNGKLNGIIERLNENGNVELRGHLVNGVEHGLFRRFYNSKMMRMGYYSNGGWYSEVIESKYMKGLYVERSVENGTTLSIAQYDDELIDKNGYCIEYVNGEMTECVYEHGEKVSMTDRCGHNERKRDHVNEKNENESKRVRVDLSTIPIEQSLIQYDMVLHCEYGVWIENDKCYELKQSMLEKRLIEGDLKSYEMSLYKNELKERTNGENGCIDLDVSGRRWEGGVMDGKPFGYGVLYNEEGRKEYEGFMMGEMKCLYGKEYYDDIERVEYAGCFFDGNRFGKGIEYDRNEVIVYNGLWRDNDRYTSDYKKEVIDNRMKSLTIAKGSNYDMNTFTLSPVLGSLKRIEIGYNSMDRIRVFRIHDMNTLERIVIERCCFTYIDYDLRKSEIQRNDGVCKIVNCPKLRLIQIDDQSFSDYHSFELMNLPSLQSITMGEKCFHWTPMLTLKCKRKASISIQIFLNYN